LISKIDKSELSKTIKNKNEELNLENSEQMKQFDKMAIDNIYIQQLRDNLKELNPHLILLFGSYAYGTPNKDSDIDLIVVTNDNYLPKTFTEQTELYINVSEHILSISKQIPVDLIVYTLPMYKEFVKINNAFAKEVLNKGVILYENKHTAVA